MGLMDKFKNLFTDEEIIEEDDAEPIEIKEVKKEEEVNKLPTFMREKIEKEKQEAEKINVQKQEISELQIKKELKLDTELENEVVTSPKLEEKNTFKFPVDFSENDFVETRSRQSMHQRRVGEEPIKNREESRPMIKKEQAVSKTSEVKVADLYKDKKVEKKEPEARKFRATPIISPIYGVLDKNYTSGDIEHTSTSGENFEERRPSKSVDFDSVRKKAYGSLSKEIKENLMCENCEYLKEAKECQKERKRQEQSNLLYDVLEEPQEERNRDITLDEAAENYYDYGVEYEKECYPENCYINNSYSEEREEVKIVKEEEYRPEPKPKKEIPPVKSSINLLSTLKKSMGDPVDPPKKSEENLELTNDLFNLIDSMYDERNENK